MPRKIIIGVIGATNNAPKDALKLTDQEAQIEGHDDEMISLPSSR
jgi:hypothetical protein